MELTKSYQKLAETYLGNSSGNLYIRIYAKWSEQDVQNNRTKVQYQARAYFSGSYIYDQQSSGNVKGTGVSQVNYSRSSSYNNGETTLGTAEGWVTHNSDGTMSISASAYLNFPNWGWSGTASGTATLPTLHTPPELSLSSVSENSSKLSGVGGTTFVNNISEKIFTLNYSMFDSATASSLKIYDKNGNELTATTSLSSSSGTITVNFKTNPISSNVITNNKTTFTIKFTDSKNGSTTITTPEYTVIPYFAPNLITTASNVKRNGQTTGKAVLNLTGQFYNATIGNTANAITLSFKYWTGSTEPSIYYTIPSSANTGSGNNISVSSWEFKKNNTTVTDLDKSNSYKFKIKAVDSFGSEYQSIIELTLAKGEWLMAKFKNRVDFKKITIQNEEIYPNIYSTSEVVVGKWIDGKPIYRKVINIGSLPNSSSTTINHNISNVSQFINIYGAATRSSDIDTLPIPYVTFNANNSGGITIYANDTSITLRTTTDRSSYDCYIVLEYTKTTD